MVDGYRPCFSKNNSSSAWKLHESWVPDFCTEHKANILISSGHLRATVIHDAVGFAKLRQRKFINFETSIT